MLVTHQLVGGIELVYQHAKQQLSANANSLTLYLHPITYGLPAEKLLARTIQGVSKVHSGDELDKQAGRQVIYNHTWICAL